MAGSCCAKPIARIIKVGNFEAGLVGLDEALRNVYADAITDDEEIRRALLKWVRKFGNYITPTKEKEYQDALLKEYKSYMRKIEAEQKKTSVRS